MKQRAVGLGVGGQQRGVIGLHIGQRLLQLRQQALGVVVGPIGDDGAIGQRGHGVEDAGVLKSGFSGEYAQASLWSLRQRRLPRDDADQQEDVAAFVPAR